METLQPWSNRKPRLAALLTTIFAFALALAPPSRAQRIECGQTITGSITNNETDSYTFEARAGEVIIISLGKGSGAFFEPVADVYDPTGHRIGGCTNGATPPLTLTTTGTYTVLVHDSDYSSWNDSMYGLALSFATCRCGTQLVWGAPTARAFPMPAGGTDSYRFYANNGAVALISVSKNSGTFFDAVADLYDPTGRWVGSCTNGATPPLTLTNTGCYTVLVHDADYYAWDDSAYTLSLSFVLFPPPYWLAIGRTNDAVVLTLWGVLGRYQTVQYATNLAAPIEWFPLTNLTLPYSPYSFVDWSPPATQRFYRFVPAQ